MSHKPSSLPLAAFAALALATTALTAPAAGAEFPAVIELSSLNGTTGFRLKGIDGGDQSGNSVASAGDVNGDGFGDIIVGAYEADPNGVEHAGESYVVFGKPGAFGSAINLATLNGGNGFRIDGSGFFDESGYSVASAGDVNGDGFGDIIISAHYANSEVGECYVVFGKASGFASVIDLASLNGTTGFRLNGIDASDEVGNSVASAGDVNGDGFGDLIIGAEDAYQNGNDSAGESYVVFGKASQFASAIELSSLNGATGFRLNGTNQSDNSGHSVASAGDVNGDGFGDVIIGAYRASPNGNYESGESFAVFGKAAGFASAIDLSSLNGTTGFRLVGIDAGDYSGQSVASAGDLNGDGFGDIVIGAHRAEPNGVDDAGESYVVFGKASGFSSAVQLSSLNGATGFRLRGDADDRSGESVASAGDVNGDGFADLVIGARTAGRNGVYAVGKSYVVFGKASGFVSAVQLSSLNGTTGFRLDGIDNGDRSGDSVASAGDVNGDGFADIVIGAYSRDQNGKFEAGESYVVFGRAPDTARTRRGSAVDQYISGGAFADTLSGLDGDDSLEGRGGGDVLRGGTGLDAASYAHAAAAVIADLAAPAGNTGEAAGDSYGAIENLTGSRFADTLSGNAAGNVLTGGAGRDRLTGKGGADIFKFLKPSDSPPGTRRDVISDLDAATLASKLDRIDLSAIDARTGPGNQAFTFIGTAPFDSTKGRLRVRGAGTAAIAEGDINGDNIADFEIGLANVRR